MAKKAYDVVCPYGDSHKFPIVLDVEPEGAKEDVQSPIDVFCPMCGKFVRVNVKGEMKPDVDLLRRYQ